MPKSKNLIVFSGIDGAGKSTQIELLMQHLITLNKKPVYYWSRGGYTGPFNLFKKILRKILGKKALPSGRTQERQQIFNQRGIAKLWLTLAILDLILVYGFYLRWLKLIGKTVIADRYLKDTWIDFKLNFPQINFEKKLLWKLLKIITPKADYTFLLLIPVEESLKRSQLKNEPFPDSQETLEKRLAFYQGLSQNNTWHVIDCMEPINEIAKNIVTLLNC